MFGKTWKTSERSFNVLAERGIYIPVGDGAKLCAEIYRPDGGGRFPAILGAHPYVPYQAAPVKPAAISTVGVWGEVPGEELPRSSLEAGDPNFFVRRGYVHVICNLRGTGKSEGRYRFLGQRELQDVCEVIEWIAEEPWCNGMVGMFGVSYLAWIQLYVASMNPPHLRCIFAPWAATDQYRDMFYHGGILARLWAVNWPKSLHSARFDNYALHELGEEGFKDAINHLLEDEDIGADPALLAVLRNPDQGANPLTITVLLHPFYDSFWRDRAVNYETISVPAYIGADWITLHLPGAFRSWENLKGSKKMIVGPPTNLDRPVYQLHYEALRWFDYWLKGIDTGIMQEPPIRLFVMGSNEWKEAAEWPLPDTKWTPFYLHEDALLSEHEHWPNEGSDSFEDSPWHRGYLLYSSPSLVENTEVIGPILLDLFASTTDTDIFWVTTIRDVAPDGGDRIVARGWLRGSHRAVDLERSKPWEPFHTHTQPQLLTPNQLYEFKIRILPTANLFKSGHRIALKIGSADDEPKNALESVLAGHLRRRPPSRITVYHNSDHPSYLLLPITSGNVLGTFMSGGRPFISS